MAEWLDQPTEPGVWWHELHDECVVFDQEGRMGAMFPDGDDCWCDDMRGRWCRSTEQPPEPPQRYKMEGDGDGYRISTNDSNDDRVAICWDRENAELILEALNSKDD